MTLNQPYFVLAYYAFVTLDDPRREVMEHKAYLEQLDAKCRIYLSEEGINGQMSASRADALRYIDWLHSKPPFKYVDVKVHEWHEHVFPRLTIKYRKNLVAREKRRSFKTRPASFLSQIS